MNGNNKKLRQKLLILSIVLGGVFVFYILSKESFYAKQTIGERIWKTIVYAGNNQLALAANVLKKNPTFTLDMPLYKQEHRITCEVAALRMALGRYEIDVSEDELLEILAFDTREPLSDGVWGDPDNGFVGDPDGALSKYTGYGVYEYPIRNLARKYRPAEVLENPDIYSITNLVSAGKPVIAWGVIAGGDKIYWRTLDGKEIEAHPGEHVRVVVGFIGEASNPERLILHDPIYGRIIMSKAQFLKEWKLLGNRAVVLN